MQERVDAFLGTEEMQETPGKLEKGCVRITGTPGIGKRRSPYYLHLTAPLGKTTFLHYYLARRLAEKKITMLYDRHDLFLFTAQNTIYYSNDPSKISFEPWFSDAVCFQEAVCELGLAPKLITSPEYAGVANYAYHLDAGRFASFVREHCVKNLGIRHIVDEVTEVVKDDKGDIAYVETSKSGRLGGDLFIDASGFRSLLLGQALGVPFVDCSDVLFIDRALAMQVPYDDEQSNIVPHTLATAQKNGWIWDIGLQSRRGVGYVFSSSHTTADAALSELRAYVGAGHDDLQPREIKIVSGHRRTFWQGNCVAVGLAGGFLEPLEASALVLIELSADMISAMMPATRETMDIVAKRFNATTQYRWDRIIDFLKLHYILSQRTDSKFWIDNRHPDSIPESLKEQMELWRYRAPGDQDFMSTSEMFPAASYQYVLFGMGFRMDVSARPLDRDIGTAQRAFAQNATLKAKWTKALPKNRDLINKIKELGLQKI